MNRKLNCLLFLLGGYHIIAQNLVPNPSFETYLNCDSLTWVNVGNFPPWDSPSLGSVDGYNACSIVSALGTPNNQWGYQLPHTGNVYVGGEFYNWVNDWEYIQVELDSVLLAGQKYCASFYVSVANRSRLADNNIGMYFSNTHTYVSSGSYLNVTPQINDTNIISDTLNWTLISGQYIAQGGERYIIVGCFYPYPITDTLHLNGTGSAGSAYYYIDDVSVMRCSNVGIEEVTKQSNFKLYPNPNTGSMTLEYTLETSEVAVFSIYAMDGRLVKQQALNAQNKTASIDASELDAGIYYYVVKEGNKNTKSEKLIIIK